ncbi:hypothetical protein [Halobiforma nitratireducens]|uniref:hypothetical protein n=1 Tax=Halobiforma nitratireducens TaxID=130048 RepID=UPI001267B486|nr:hypothetical protein [Halobiforma nitratireducens]
MSDRDNISRRKTLLTTGALSGSLLAVPAAAAAKTEEGDQDELTEEELIKALEDSEIVVTKSEQTDSRSRVDSQQSNVVDDTKVYVGENKNAEPPAGSPVAVEMLC